ncbi:SRPBCC domain-containing protein [Candidatus Microgenomates bacterium]|nr:MAG: SRPBCC domain-containing protein [Candidatus Microgenomates bacterium]
MSDKEQIEITHIFEAPVASVWKAWTTPELIKKWWGPQGFTAPSIKIDFRVGGKYVYAMHGPKGSEWDRDMYSAGIFKEIIPPDASTPGSVGKIVTSDYFSDKDGNKIAPSQEGQDKDFPTEMTATFLFEDLGNSKTKLTIIYPKPENEAQWEAMLKSGMKEGWGSSLEKLERVIV